MVVLNVHGGVQSKARRQVVVILVASSCALVGLGAVAFRNFPTAVGAVIAATASSRLIDEAPPGGFDAQLSPKMVRSPLDWRLRQLCIEAGIRPSPIIWTRRILFVFAFTVYFASWMV